MVQAKDVIEVGTLIIVALDWVIPMIVLEGTVAYSPEPAEMTMRVPKLTFGGLLGGGGDEVCLLDLSVG